MKILKIGKLKEDAKETFDARNLIVHRWMTLTLNNKNEREPVSTDTEDLHSL